MLKRLNDHANRGFELRCAIFWRRHLEVALMLGMELMAMMVYPNVLSMSILSKNKERAVRSVMPRLDRSSWVPRRL